MVEVLNADRFAKIIRGQVPVIVDFWASWCGPCKMLAPVFEDVSKDYAGKLQFAKISTEDFPEVAEEYGITGIPCLVVFKGGEEVERIVGFAPKPLLKQKIDQILAKA